MKRLVLAALALLAFTVSPVAETRIITYDSGGKVSDYNQRWQTYANSGTRVVIDGDCISACGRFMSLPNVCATRRGYFYLHAITRDEGDRIVVDRKASAEDSRRWETAAAYLLERRYGVFSFGFVSGGPRKEVYLEPGVWVVYEPVGSRRGNLQQVFLRVRATNLVKPC